MCPALLQAMVASSLLLRAAAFPARLPMRFPRRQAASLLSATQKVVFLGTPDVAARSLQQLHDAGVGSGGAFEVCCVVSQPAQLMGRGKKRTLTPSPVEAMANTLGLATLSPEKAKDEDFLAALEAMAPDLCVTAAYGQYLPKRFLKIPRCGTLNIHPSLLPRWRGASPVQRSLEAGDRETGVSVLWTVSKMDAGNMAAQRRRGLDGHEKATELLDELFGLGTNELIGLLPKVWSGECTPETSTRQADEGVVAADKITVHEAQVCFELDSAHKVHNKVRGFAGWPGVWTPLRVGGEAGEEGEIGEGGESERFKLITTQVASLTHLQQFLSPSSSSSPSSSVHVDLEQLRRGRNVIVERGRMFVLCAPDKKKNDEPSPGPSFSVLEILEIQAAGKKPVGAKAFANGVRGKAVRWVPQEKKRD